jgi:hypothetical protein
MNELLNKLNRDLSDSDDELKRHGYRSGSILSYDELKLLLQMLKKRGGKRPGAGRPKLKDSQKKEPTKVMRVPHSKVEEVNKIIKK